MSTQSYVANVKGLHIRRACVEPGWVLRRSISEGSLDLNLRRDSPMEDQYLKEASVGTVSKKGFR